MLRFAAFSEGKPARSVNLAGAYLIGSDDVPLRADIAFADGVVSCRKRAAGPAAIALLRDVEGVGTVLVETTRLLERDRPYNLHVELARGRLNLLIQKVEDWGLADHEEAGPALERFQKGREILIEALQADTPATAADIADQALTEAVQASEELTRIHAEALLQRRRSGGGLGRRVFGCTIDLAQTSEAYRKPIGDAIDFVSLPVVWRDIEPREQQFNWKPLDSWIESLAKRRIPMKGSALLSFSEKNIPDWLYIWEHDFETIRDLAFEHIRRVMARYNQYVPVWDVVSGIHAHNSFTFTFEQLMELTRMATAAAKQVSSRCLSVVNIVAPWGEYYARNQRTIPPLLYADMVMQSGLNFDAFGLQVCFGPARDGLYVRDMFQLSSMLDEFGKMGKPVHLTAVGVPSNVVPPPGNGSGDDESEVAGGFWREPWNDQVQADWARQALIIALSKPFVERVCWCALSDQDASPVPAAGLLDASMTPKPVYERVRDLRAELTGGKRRGK